MLRLSMHTSKVFHQINNRSEAVKSGWIKILIRQGNVEYSLDLAQDDHKLK